MKYLVLTILYLSFYPAVFSQETSSDTAAILQEVEIRAYEQHRQLKEVAAAVNVISTSQLERFNNTSILPALNATPGVHMEERSPGSYRLNIRGSSLRSPFGVRNVKVYWNGIPFTDPGGNTYLNQLGFYNIKSVEIIKGPASSLYGAGTGGAVLLSSQPENWEPGVTASYLGGSYRLSNLHVELRTGRDSHRNTIGYMHQTSDGYRDHTRMRRDVATWETTVQANSKQQLQASVLYGDLFYETPGGLNLADYTSNPEKARGPAGPNLGAEEAQAAIHQKTFLAGLQHTYRFTGNFNNRSVVYGAFSFIKNPTFRNFEKRTEPHLGGRTVFTWKKQAGNTDLAILAGAEAQRGFFNTKTFVNDYGQPGSLMTDDDLDNWIWSAFVQTDIRFPGDWIVNAGVSINRSSITITRLSAPSLAPVKQTYNSEYAPRLAISKKLVDNTWWYASIARGFSPPTDQELLPSTSVISTGLQAEHGINYETGIKSGLLQQRIYAEVNFFYYRLQNAIVLRRDGSGADYFVNAGATKQAGLETQVYYQLLPNRHRFVNRMRIGLTHTWNRFRYDDFIKDTINYNDKAIPGVAPNTLAFLADIITNPGLYAHITWYYNDPVALDDANTVYATSFNLLSARAGFKKTLHKNISADLFAGVENIFNTKYSLGNDLNAFGGRYFNAAAGVNYFGGISLNLMF